MKPALILQLRPEDDASDGEYRAFLDKGGLDEGQARGGAGVGLHQ